MIELSLPETKDKKLKDLLKEYKEVNQRLKLLFEYFTTIETDSDKDGENNEE